MLGFPKAQFKSFPTEAQCYEYVYGARGPFEASALRASSESELRRDSLPIPSSLKRPRAADDVEDIDIRRDSPRHIACAAVSRPPTLPRPPDSESTASKPAASSPPEHGKGIFLLQFDGGSSGNPGPGGAGAVIKDARGGLVAESSVFVGAHVTNNVAEYTGLISGLHLARDLGIKHLRVEGDSKLVIEQVSGRWLVSAPHLVEPSTRARTALRSFEHITLHHIRRELNSHADRLATEASRRRGDSVTKH